MGDVRFAHPYERLRSAQNLVETLRSLSDEDVVQALAASAEARDPYVANILASDALNRIRRKNAILDAAAEGVLALDSQWRITFVNPAAERMLRARARDLRGIPFAEALEFRTARGERMFTPNCPVLAGLTAGDTLTIEEAAFHRADGTSFPSSCTAAPILWHDEVHGAVLLFSDITERKRAETVREQQAAAIRASMDGIALIDPDERLTYVNEAHAEIHGYPSPADLKGMPWRALYDPNEAARLDEEVMPVLLRESRWRGEAIGLRRDGTRCHQELSLTRLPNGCIVCIARDITDRKRAEEALRRSEQSYRLLAENASDIVSTTEFDGTITYFSPAARHVLGYDPEAIRGRSWTDLMDPRDVPRVQAACLHLLESSGPATVTYRARRADGTLVWLESTARVAHDPANGEPLEVVSVTRDITDRRRILEATRENEARLRALMNALPFACWTLDREGIITSVLGHAFGGPPRDYIGVSAFELVSDDENTAAAVREALEGKEVSSFYQLGDRWLRVQYAPLRDPQGNLVGTVGVGIDITDQKRLEAALREREALLASSQALARLGSWEWDLRTNEVTWSEQLHRVVGTTPGEWRPTTESVTARVHPDDREALARTLERAIEERVPFTYSHRVLRTDGGITRVIARGAVLTDDQGEPTRVVGTVQEVPNE